MTTFDLRTSSPRARRFNIWTPRSLVGLQVWLDASQETYANDDPVSTANDWSGHARHFTAAGTDRPLFKTTGGSGGRPCVLHDGVSQYLVAGSAWQTGFIAGEVFIVLKRTTTSNKGVWVWSNSGGNAQFYPFSGTCYEVFGTDARKDNITPGATLTDWHLLNELSSPGLWEARWNGVVGHTTTSNTVDFTPANETGIGSKVALGTTRNLSTFFDGSWSEMIMVNRVLSANERAQVNNYLAQKWALIVNNG